MGHEKFTSPSKSDSIHSVIKRIGRSDDMKNSRFAPFFKPCDIILRRISRLNMSKKREKKVKVLVENKAQIGPDEKWITGS